jgi:hypothetical protein
MSRRGLVWPINSCRQALDERLQSIAVPSSDAFDRNDGLGVTGKDKHRCRALFGSEKRRSQNIKGSPAQNIDKSEDHSRFLGHNGNNIVWYLP